MDEAKKKKIIKLSRNDMGILTRYPMGHVHLRRHDKTANAVPQYRLMDPNDRHIGSADDDIRHRLYQMRDTEETPFHLLGECLALWEARRELLGNYTFEGQEYICWDPSALVRFYKLFDLENEPN